MGIVNIFENNAKNYFINGSQRFWQVAGASVPVNYPVSFDYVSSDQVATQHTGTAWTVVPTSVRSAIIPTNKGLEYSFHSVGTPSNIDNKISHRYRIEANESVELVDKGMSFSSFFRSDNYTGIDVQINYADAENDFSTVTLVSNLSKSIIADDTFQLAKFENIVLPSNAKNGIEIIITTTAVNTGVASNLYMAGLMINRGEASISYKRAGLDESGETSLCQRFFEKSYNLDTPVGTVTSIGIDGSRTNSSSRIESVDYRATKLSIPVVTGWNPFTGLAGTWRNVSISTNPVFTLLAGTSSERNFTTNITISGANRTVEGHYTADARL